MYREQLVDQQLFLIPCRGCRRERARLSQLEVIEEKEEKVVVQRVCIHTFPLRAWPKPSRRDVGNASSEDANPETAIHAHAHANGGRNQHDSKNFRLAWRIR